MRSLFRRLYIDLLVTYCLQGWETGKLVPKVKHNKFWMYGNTPHLPLDGVM